MSTYIGDVLHMQIGHTGHTRPLELIVSIELLVIAARIIAPIHSAVYTNIALKLVFAGLIAWPAVWLMLARSLIQRKRALLGMFITYVYSGLLGLVVDVTRFASAGALLDLAAVAGYLYFATAWEIKWRQDGLSLLPPPAPE